LDATENGDNGGRDGMTGQVSATAVAARLSQPTLA